MSHEAGARPLPMFPLGTVLFPTMLLPLRVFEPRYRALVQRCLATGEGFGVTLIERGSEVGGGDVRADVGCAAAIVHAEELPTGEWNLICLGTDRVRVTQWLDDDPHPWAMAEAWPDRPAPPDDGELTRRAAELARRLRSLLALAVEMGEWDVPLDVEFSEDPALAGYQIAALSPLGPFDRQRVLSRPDAAGRLDVLSVLLDEVDVTLRARLAEE